MQTSSTSVNVLPEGSAAANPGFDVTPAPLVTGIITERGVPPATAEGLRHLYPELDTRTDHRAWLSGAWKLECPMARYVPFFALRFNPSRLPETAKVIAPPYDIISANERAVLEAQHARNIVHLDLPRGEGNARSEHARALLDTWMADGSLREDPQPALYRYSRSFLPIRAAGRARIRARAFSRSSSFRRSRRAWCCRMSTRCRDPRSTASSSSRPRRRKLRRSSPSIAIPRAWPRRRWSAPRRAFPRWMPPRPTAAGTDCGW